MSRTSRRKFLKTSTLATAGATVATDTILGAQNRAGGANERVNVALIGCGGMGTNHLRSLLARRDVTVSYVCEVDRDRLATAGKLVQQSAQREPRAVEDMRRVFEDRSVDAVFIATPDHWHAPAAILAVDAGKHVYVEKPCSHNIREGRLMIDAARRARKVMQVGTQSRSTPHVREAVDALRKNEIGDVLAVRVWNSQLRRNIGHMKPSEPPANLNYDMWVGPAPMVPYQANRRNPIWRWWYDFGTGDMGNDGVHDIDIALWGLGVTTHPTTVTALGGKYFFDDDQQFPDTQTVIFEYPAVGKNGHKRQLIFEQRIWCPYKEQSYENGDSWFGTRGMLVLGKEAGWTLYGPRNKEVRRGTGSPDLVAHHNNFFECIRSGQRPHADIEIAHLAATLCHLGNIATRVRKTLTFDPQSEQITNDRDANALVRRRYREGHWAVPRNV